MDMGGRARLASAGPHRPFGESSQADHPVVHDKGAGDGEIDAELRGDLHQEIAALDEILRQARAFGAQHIGCLVRMGEAGQIDGIIHELDAHQPAAMGQMQIRQSAEGMGAAQQAAEIHRLADALDADAEISAHDGEACMGSCGAARCFIPINASRGLSVKSEDMTNQHPPLIVEVTRGKAEQDGDFVESRHRCHAAVVDRDGTVVRKWGDVDQPIYGRSAIKPMLALGLVESGAADAFKLGNAEIALACASHSGEPQHVDRVRAWLQRIGRSPADLECGAHMPYNEVAMRDMVRAGIEPDASHNNCSGKHSGFLTTAVHLKEPTKGYIRYEHPIQQRLLGIMEQLSGLDLSHAPRGVDGCGIPTIALPIAQTAMAMARLADPQGLPPARAAAAKRIVTAMTAEPYMVGGAGEFCSEVMHALGGKAALKPGAEGVYAGILPELGLGICLKNEDGAGRGCEVAMAQILVELGVLSAEERAKLADRLTPPVVNRAGLKVGRIRAAADAAF